METMPHDRAETLSFLMPNIFTKFEQRHPNGGAKWRWGRL